MDLALETTDLSRSFGTFRAVDGVGVRVEPGSFYGFLGPNGAGKSTTIKMLTGLLAPTSGRMRVLGLDPCLPEQALEMKRRIGVVPEDLALLENLTAREYLTFVGRMHSMAAGLLSERIDELLALLSLEGDEAKLTLEYSHGMKKKLALAAALLPDPDLLFLDEPFEGVDAVASRTIRRILTAFVERGSTVFLTSHVLEIVERVCDQVGIIVGGKLVEQTSLAELGGGGSLEHRFLEVVGSDGAAAEGLSWLAEDGP
ncbi:MAG: ABC transporter ATP-binding protein [Planctomycetota bacterium]|jgi:ABC-2 type transport system ATP-binding protein|nr:ABC transporter ATP-binding protein [Planctomycetota bacterium]MDP6762482.1 ABC transporter ATP-binding protein [Planctomycetota bacterium]MDP6990754.1 ABC transporter ATP-binding protein [Planctomycetota bacterium]